MAQASRSRATHPLTRLRHRATVLGMTHDGEPRTQAAGEAQPAAEARSTGSDAPEDGDVGWFVDLPVRMEPLKSTPTGPNVFKTLGAGGADAREPLASPTLQGVIPAGTL